MSDLPHVFLQGNCQIHFLGAFLEALYPGRVRVVGQPFGRKPEFHGLVPEYVSDAEVGCIIGRYLGRKDPVVFIRQATPLGVGAIPAGVDAKSLSADIVVPHLELYCIWPEGRGIGSPDDRKIVRLYEGDLAAIESSASMATVFRDASDVVAATVVTEPCFNSCVHPRGDLFAGIAKPVISAIEGKGVVSKCESLLKDLANTSVLDFDLAHPVPMRYLAALGFEWGDRYLAWAEGRTALENGDFQRAYDKLLQALGGYPNSWKLRGDLARAAIGAGDIERGLSYFDWARRNTISPNFQSNALWFLLRHGMPPDAVFRRAGMAIEMAPSYAPLHANLAQACLKDSTLGDPEAHARIARELEPENEHFVCLIAQIFWSKSRRREAVSCLETFVAGHAEARNAAELLSQYGRSLNAIA